MIEILVGCLHPAALKEKIKSDLDYKRTINKDWKVFLVHAPKMTEHIQLGYDSAARIGGAQEKKKQRKASHSKGKNDAQVLDHHKPCAKCKNSGASTSAQGGQKRLSKWLDEAFSEYNLLHHRKMNSADLAKKLVQRHREKNEADTRAVEAVMTNSSRDVPDSPDGPQAKMNSTVFRACFAHVYGGILCADIGSDIKFLSTALLNELQENGAKMTVVTFAKVRYYGLAVTENADSNTAKIICDKQVTLDPRGGAQ